ncbi:Hypothetical protein CINCED_3A025605 [Cinara cedri]|uniref:Uncharacterized protein n=1 Tax=Cinara cedri TaxID=506608 RepID=A0A5E4M574_9HEMI|nr:Hypothetical protein CINCED_3A025605 [Cinara cedri]
MASSVMIQAAIIGFLVISTAFADTKLLKKNNKRYSLDVENINLQSSVPSAFSSGSRYFGPSTPAPFIFDSSFSRTSAPFKSFSYSSTPAPFIFGNSLSSSSFSRGAVANAIDGSSTPAPFFGGDSFFGTVTVDRPVPYPVEKSVPYPVQVPVEVKVPVPVSAPTQRFATVHYYQGSPAALGYGSSQALIGKSGYNQFLSGAGPTYGSSLYSANSSPASFYSSTPASASLFGSYAGALSGYSSTASPLNAYSSTAASPAGFFDSNVAQEGFVSSTSSPFGFGQNSFYSSSTPAPFNSFSADSASVDSSLLTDSANWGSSAGETVAAEDSSTEQLNIVKK